MVDFAPRSLGEHPPDPAEEAKWVAGTTRLDAGEFLADGKVRSLLLRPDRTFNAFPFEDEMTADELMESASAEAPKAPTISLLICAGCAKLSAQTGFWAR